MKESATDPRTGLIDMDLLATGISMTSRHHLDALKHEVRNLIAQHASSTVRWTVLQREINSQSSVIVSHKDFDQVMNELETEQFIKVTGGKGARTIRRLGARATQPMHDDQ
jgi:DNA replication licensing factor MCM4